MLEKMRADLELLLKSFDVKEIAKRLAKYLIEGAAVAAAVYYIPKVLWIGKKS